MVLGMTGGFGPAGFALGHLVVFSVVAFGRRKHLREDLVILAGLLRSGRSAPTNERIIGAVLATVLGALSLIAVIAEPAVLDSLNYHLPRLAHWLQDGRITMLGSSDQRLDYISSLPEVVMAWMLGPVKEGFRGTVLLQAVGGAMAIGATIGLAEISGLDRAASMLAGSLLLGMANVAAQFTAAQTDLFTAGAFSVAFYLWLVALLRRETSWCGALGAGFALGAKGTLFYLAPGALLWIAWLWYRHSPSRRLWFHALVAGVAGVILFAGPGMWRNWQTYGDPRGPTGWIEKFHPHLPSLAAKFEKLKWNAVSAVAQTFAPASQPDGLQSVGRKVGLALVELLPQNDPYTFLGQERRAGLTGVLSRDISDADTASFGAVTLLLFLSSTLAAALGAGRESAKLMLTWSGGVWMFFLYFNFLHQWHPFSFRYYVIAAPWIAVVSAWGIQQVQGYWRTALWIVVVLASSNILWRVTVRTHQGGLQTIIHPERTIGSSVADGWRRWSENLLPPGSPLTIALPDDRPLAAFYRQAIPRHVQYLSIGENERTTVEEILRGTDGWLIVPCVKMLGREGRVRAKTWLFNGDEFHPCSLVAYHALDPGERPVPFLYRQRWVQNNHSNTHELLVKTFDESSLELILENPSEASFPFTWSTPLAQGRETLPPKTKIALAIPVAPQSVVEVRLRFSDDPSFINARPIITLRP